MSVLLGLDVGTGGARAVAVDEGSGEVEAEVSSEYPFISLRSGRHLRYVYLPYHCR
jgi:xylulokinase